MRTTNQNRATEAAPADHAPLTDSNVGILFKDWIRSYKELTGTTVKLVMADTKLAAISLTHIIALALLACFAALGAWACLLALVATALLALGMNLMLVITLFLVAHVVVLALLLYMAKSTASGLDFSATKQVLTVNQQEHSNECKDSVETAASRL